MEYFDHHDRLSSHTRDLDIHQRSIDFCRWLACLYEENGAPHTAAKLFIARFPRAVHRPLIEKAVVLAGGTTDATWAGPLAPLEPLASAFLEFARPMTLLGRVPYLRKLPFNISVTVQTGAGIYGWIGQGAPAAVTSASYGAVTLPITKAGGIITITAELLRISSPDAAALLRQEMAAGVAAYLDAQFIDPANAPVLNVSPGSVTNGITAIPPSGTSSAAVVVDVDVLTATFIASNPDVTRAVLLMPSATCSMLARASKVTTLSNAEGGQYAGYTVIVSEAVGPRIVMVDANAIFYADGGVEFDMSKNATIQLNSAPDNPAVAATVETSLWQANLVGLRTVRYVNWKRARNSAVQFIAPTAYVSGT